MEITVFFMIPIALIVLAVLAVGIYLSVKLLILVFRALKKYLDGDRNRGEEVILRKSLGEVLKEYRMRCSMTQEFVAEAMGVSRQAVSKWENGTADPTTGNLLKLAKLYGISPEELIRSIQSEQE